MGMLAGGGGKRVGVLNGLTVTAAVILPEGSKKKKKKSLI